MPRKTNYEMWKLARRMNQLMDEWMHAGFRGDPEELWEPSADVIECEGGIHVLAEIAGMDRSDIKVTFSGNQLTLSGCRRLLDVDKKTQILQMELPCGKFRRTLDVPFPIDGSLADIKYENGLLAIFIRRP